MVVTVLVTEESVYRRARDFVVSPSATVVAVADAVSGAVDTGVVVLVVDVAAFALSGTTALLVWLDQ